MIQDHTFNKSAVLDIESALIKYMVADGQFNILNKNLGLTDSDYYDRVYYTSMIPSIWKQLQGLELAKKDIIQIENSDLFKFSPYKVLTDDQDEAARLIMGSIDEQGEVTWIINGMPGSGKTILAVYLLKLLASSDS